MAKSFREQLSSVVAQIAALTIRKTELEGKVGSEVDPAAIVAGAIVTFLYGKGETRRPLTGTVVAVKPADPAKPTSSAQVKVAVGTGFDAAFLVITPAQVTKVGADDEAAEVAAE